MAQSQNSMRSVTQTAGQSSKNPSSVVELRHRRVKKYDSRPGDVVDHGQTEPEVKGQGDNQGQIAMETSNDFETDYESNGGAQAGIGPGDHRMVISGTQQVEHPRPPISSQTEWQFYLDYLSTKISSEINEIAIYLHVESGKVVEIKNRCRSNRHEMCFHVLWMWYSMNSDNEKRHKQITMALKESGRMDLSNELKDGTFPRPENFTYAGAIQGPSQEVNGSDSMKVAKQLTWNFQSLARYFGLDENSLQTIIADDSEDVKEQSYNTLRMCINQRKLRTRQQLCNGLTYLELNTLIEDLARHWTE